MFVIERFVILALIKVLGIFVYLFFRSKPSVLLSWGFFIPLERKILIMTRNFVYLFIYQLSEYDKLIKTKKKKDEKYYFV